MDILPYILIDYPDATTKVTIGFPGIFFPTIGCPNPISGNWECLCSTPGFRSEVIKRGSTKSAIQRLRQNHTALKFHLCHKSSCVAVIDTGSNIIAMPNEAVRSRPWGGGPGAVF